MTSESAPPVAAKGADLRFKISDDGMIAIVEAYQPPQSGEPPISAAELAKALQDAGIVDPTGPAFDDAVTKAAAGEDITGIVVAKGTPPTEPKDAELTILGDTENPVFHGDIFAKLSPARQAAPGTTLRGELIAPKSTTPPKTIECPKDGECKLHEKTQEVVANAYGLVDFRSDTLTVKPLMSVSEDKLAIRTTVYPQAFSGTQTSLDMFKRNLWAMGVYGVNETIIRKALVRARHSNEPQEDVMVAKGVPPKHGVDGWFEVLLEEDKDMPNIDSLGDLDPRERSIFTPVKEGTPIGRIILPQEGHFGRDVFGDDLVPRKGKPSDTAPGDNISLSEDETLFSAAISGMVTWEGNRISVLEMVHVAGDVDYSTGNIKLENGAVRIDGSVRDGFRVAAPGDISIGGAVEGCRLVAAGSIGVSGGIVMGGMGLVQAKGDISATFMENSILEAGGNISCVHNLSNSNISAGEKVLCFRGKGIIMGGQTKAAKGIEANEIGTEFGVKTTLILSLCVDSEEMSELVMERRRLKTQLSSIFETVGNDDPKAILGRTPEDKLEDVGRLLKARIGIEKRLKAIRKELDAMRETMISCQDVRVKARRIVHPGVTIKAAGKSLTIKERSEACSFYYDPVRKLIVKA